MKTRTFFAFSFFATLITTFCFSQSSKSDTLLVVDIKAIDKPTLNLDKKNIVAINSAKVTYTVQLKNADKKAILKYYVSTSDNSGLMEFQFIHDSVIANRKNIFSSTSSSPSSIKMLLFDTTKGRIAGKLYEFIINYTGSIKPIPPKLNLLKVGDSLFKKDDCYQDLQRLSAFEGNAICNSEDIIDPCETPRINRILFDGEKNQVHYFNRHGKEFVTFNGKLADITDPTPGFLNISSKEKDGTLLGNNNNIRVKAGDPLTFEVFNVNPDDYSVQITDTTIVFYQQTNAILSQLMGAIPSIATATATGIGPSLQVKLGKSDSIKAALTLLADQLSQFFIKIKYSGDNIFFQNMIYKREAKIDIDKFLNKYFQKPYGQSIEAFMSTYLSGKGADSILASRVSGVYDQLPTAIYHMERFMLVPKGMDKITFSFNIVAKPNTPYLGKATKYQIDALIYGCWKVDVSAGFYYAPTMTSDNYSLHADSTFVKGVKIKDSITGRGNNLVNESTGTGEMGIQGLVHFSYKFTPNFSAGFHAGAGVNVTDFVTPRYFTGLSLLFGREWGRIALNGGYVFGNVQQLSNIYTKNSNGQYDTLSPTATSVQYVKKFMAKPYFGITYSIPFGLGSQTATASPSASTGGWGGGTGGNTGAGTTTSGSGTGTSTGTGTGNGTGKWGGGN
ncbi:MAG: hypothetical protein ACLQQ4_17370 [Bacteroidia bacterium]